MCFVVALLFFGCSSGSKPKSWELFFAEKINPAIPLEDRIKPAPAHVIDWLHKLDSTTGYKPYMPAENEKALFTSYVQLLPRQFKQVIQEKTVVIYFIDNLMYGGMNMIESDDSGNNYGVIFLNREILRRTASDWMNFRDNSFFYDDGSGITLVSEWSGDYFALIHTLVHETAHLYDHYFKITPFVDPPHGSEASALQTDFTANVWKNYYLPLDEFNFPYRSELSAYGLGPAQKKSLAPEIYRSLQKTPFVSLYGSQSWAEDFAEAFTFFYLAKYLDVNMQVKIIDAETNEELLIYKPTQNPLLAGRFDAFERICE